MNKLKTLKGAVLVAATSMLPLSQAAMADVTISGWINEGVTFYDDGVSSDAVQITDNGNTLGSRITFAASSEVATGITAGMEVILEPRSTGTALGWGTFGVADDTNGHALGVLGSSLHVGGGWGKVTVGLQSMPTDNIAVLEDPSLTLWSGISPIFRGNGVTIQGPGIGLAGGLAVAGDAPVWGNFLNCFGAPSVLRGAVGIGIDCNGIYRNGVRYDLPAFGPVSIAIGYANDDVYDIMAKWKGNLGRMKASVALGYSINQGINGPGSAAGAATATAALVAGTANATDIIYFDESETFQMQAGLMDPVTGLFGSIAYQSEEADVQTGAQAVADGFISAAVSGELADDSDAWWLKVGIKKQWFSVGDTSISFDYGQYNDQYGAVQAGAGVDGSEVQRIGVAIDQYFGSSLIIYGKWEQLDLDVDVTTASVGFWGSSIYGTSDELDTFTLGAVYFF